MAQPAAPSPAPVARCDDSTLPPQGRKLDEKPVPESTLHDQAVTLLCLLSWAWADRSGRRARVARNLALRWHQPQPKVGLDFDLTLYEPPPLDFDALSSVRTWLPGHPAPKLAIEVVSEGPSTKEGRKLWPTSEEAERKAKEAERQPKGAALGEAERLRGGEGRYPRRALAASSAPLRLARV